MNSKKIAILSAAFLMAGTMAAQTAVKGRVTDKDGLPIVGASVKAGNKVVAITDENGHFSIAGLPAGTSKLTVGYIGMESQTVSVSADMAIQLSEADNSLDEVIVVAYGTAKKSAFTGSATVIKSDDIAKVQTSNAVEALTGKVAGVQMSVGSTQPGQSTPSILVRGISSINAGNSPLIILDGTPFPGNLNNIAPSDIETMTVLKDAASNALYGARGANGVIMITTKKGKERSGAKITFDAKWGQNSRAQVRHDVVTDPAQYMELYYQSLRNYAINKNGLTEGEAHIWANNNMFDGDFGLSYNPYTVPAGDYLIGTNGRLNPRASLGRVVDGVDGKGYLLTPDDWYAESYRPSLRQEYNVSVSNANDMGNYYFSAGYLSNDGITHNSTYERFAARLRSELQVKSWLRLGVNMSYTHYESNTVAENGSDLFAAATGIGPIYPMYVRDANGNILKDPRGHAQYDYGYATEFYGLARPVNLGSNPISSAIYDENFNEGNAFTGNLSIDVNLAKGLKFTSTNAVTVDEGRGTNMFNPFYGQYVQAGGVINKSHGRQLTESYQQLLNYSTTFNDVHNLDAMLGHEAYRSYRYSLGASRSKVFNPYNDELDGALNDGRHGSNRSYYNTEGWFSRVQYNYDGTYFGSLSFRRDASSRFHPDHRWGNFWSAGAAWIITREDFFKRLRASWVNNLKLKMSYGEQGNDNIGDYLYTKRYTLVNTDGMAALSPSGTMANDNITWESGNNFNLGLEFGLLNNRISGQVEYFYRKTTDMLFPQYLPRSYGYTMYYDNVGDMRNSGVEVELNFGVVRTRDFQWNVGLNFTHYRNMITRVGDEHRTMQVDGHEGYTSGDNFYGEGLPLYSYYMRRYAGVDPTTGKALYYKYVYKKDANGEVMLDKFNNPIAEGTTTTDQYGEGSYYLLGTQLPDAYGGFSTSFSYKGFDLSADFSYQLGGVGIDSYYMTTMRGFGSSDRGTAIHKDMAAAWTLENPTNLPRNSFNDEFTNSPSDRFLTKLSYLSLDRINLSYTFPASVVRRLKVDNLRLYVAADNVAYISKRKGFDPRTSATGYSLIRTISAGVNVTF